MDLYHLGSKKRKILSSSTPGEDQIIEFPIDFDKTIKDALGRSFMEKISSNDNNVYFYSDIDIQSAFKLNMEIKNAISEMQKVGLKYGIDPPPIKLHINSNGGSIFAALSCIETIKHSPVEIHSFVEGGAASAATLISTCCHKRFISKHSFMLVHQLRSGMWGTMEEIRDENRNLEKITLALEDIYLNHTNLSRSSLRRLMKHDLWLDPEECLERGMVDSVLG